MNQYIWIAVAVAGLAGDIIAIGLGQHSRKHEKVNAAAIAHNAHILEQNAAALAYNAIVLARIEELLKVVAKVHPEHLAAAKHRHIPLASPPQLRSVSSAG